MTGQAWATVPLAVFALASPGGAQDLQSTSVDTLEEALIQTYDTNPAVMAERARLRGIDEDVALARSDARPKISTSATIDQNLLSRNIPGSGDRDFDLGVEISVPLFAGGRIRNAIRAADSRVEAGRADLRATEADILTEAVGAYMDVLRDRAIFELNENQVRVLQSNLEGSEARYEAGDLTLTDVAQSEARLALAQSRLGDAQGQLASSEENFRRVVGIVPEGLQAPPPLPALPGSPDEAVDLALANNADLASVSAQARAADFEVDAARGARLPTISAVSGTRYFNAFDSDTGTAGISPGSTTNTTVGLSLTMPLYQGGAGGARVRQAQALHSQLREQSVAVERSILATTRAAFAGLRAARQAIESSIVAVTANRLALEGTRAEQMAGTRTILDVLNAEQELLNSEVALVTARRDAYVAGFRLLDSMGLAEAADLNLDVGLVYDPTVNYDRYSGSWSDWSEPIGRDIISTRTRPGSASWPAF